jgi:hypothetical protein
MTEKVSCLYHVCELNSSNNIVAEGAYVETSATLCGNLRVLRGFIRTALTAEESEVFAEVKTERRAP